MAWNYCEKSRELFIENHEIFIPHLYLVPPKGTNWNFAKMFDIHKTRMTGLSCGIGGFRGGGKGAMPPKMPKVAP